MQGGQVLAQVKQQVAQQPNFPQPLRIILNGIQTDQQFFGLLRNVAGDGRVRMAQQDQFVLNQIDAIQRAQPQQRTHLIHQFLQRVNNLAGVITPIILDHAHTFVSALTLRQARNAQPYNGGNWFGAALGGFLGGLFGGAAVNNPPVQPDPQPMREQPPVIDDAELPINNAHQHELPAQEEQPLNPEINAHEIEHPDEPVAVNPQNADNNDQIVPELLNNGQQVEVADDNNNGARVIAPAPSPNPAPVQQNQQARHIQQERNLQVVIQAFNGNGANNVNDQQQPPNADSGQNNQSLVHRLSNSFIGKFIKKHPVISAGIGIIAAFGLSKLFNYAQDENNAPEHRALAQGFSGVWNGAVNGANAAVQGNRQPATVVKAYLSHGHNGLYDMPQENRKKLFKASLLTDIKCALANGKKNAQELAGKALQGLHGVITSLLPGNNAQEPVHDPQHNPQQQAHQPRSAQQDASVGGALGNLLHYVLNNPGRAIPATLLAGYSLFAHLQGLWPFTPDTN